MGKPNYEGQYVALSSNGGHVIASGDDFGAAYDKAKELGESIPTVVFVPRSDVVNIY